MEKLFKIWEGTKDEAYIIVKATHLDEGLVPKLMEEMAANKLLFSRAKIVLMADAHISGPAPVGFTMEVHSPYIAPDLISADIGCGLTSYLIKDIELTSEVLNEIVEKISQEIKIEKNNDGSQMGTLGGGNHFIEIGKNQNDILITVHSGSRGYGGEVHKNAIRGFKENQRIEKKQRTQQLINELKKEKRFDEISTMLNRQKEVEPTTTLPYVSIETSTYLEDVKKAIIWAKDSRVQMLDSVVHIIEEITNLKLHWRKIESIHNYIEFSQKYPIIRKGSIEAKYNDEVLIPLNMKDGIILGVSGVTEEVNYSLPHGAGRKFSRTKAKEVIELSEFIEEMKDIASVTVDEQRLDEAPYAYKEKDIILKDIKPYLKEYRIFETILNFKG